MSLYSLRSRLIVSKSFLFLVQGPVPGEQSICTKKKVDISTQKTIPRPHRTRRASFVMKDGHRKPNKWRPSSKKLPPLDDKAKETLNKKEIILMKTLLDIPAPFVTSMWWVVADGKSGQILFGRLENEIREIASLTKIIVLLTVLKIWKKMSLDLKKTIIEVSDDASCVGGTSAKIRAGDLLSVWDLLHGLMLPSGNDSGYWLAEYFGQLLK